MGKGAGLGGNSVKTKGSTLPGGSVVKDGGSEGVRLLRPNKAVQYRGKITYDELKSHRTPNDAWLLVRGKVYDVSGWNDHPGGNVIFTTVGEDGGPVSPGEHPNAIMEPDDCLFLSSDRRVCRVSCWHLLPVPQGV